MFTTVVPVPRAMPVCQRIRDAQGSKASGAEAGAVQIPDWAWGSHLHAVGDPGQVRQPPWGWTAAALLPVIPEPWVWWVRLRLSGLASGRALAAGAVHAAHRCARGCKALYGATGAGFVSEERKGKQRATFPIINKAAAPSILMRQGGEKNSVWAVSTQWGTIETLLSFSKGGQRHRQTGTRRPDWNADPNVHLRAPRGRRPLRCSHSCRESARGPLLGRDEAASLASGRGAAPSLARAFDPWVHVAQCGPVAQDLSPNAGLLLMR